MPEDKPAKPDVVVIVQDDRDKLYEIVHGKQVPKPVRGAREMEIVSELGCRLGIFTRDQGLGRTVMEMLFGLDPNLQGRPNVAFVSYRQWPKDRRVPRTEAWDVVPELAVEVVGETDRAEELEARIVEYLEKGVKLL